MIRPRRTSLGVEKRLRKIMGSQDPFFLKTHLGQQRNDVCGRVNICEFFMLRLKGGYAL